MIQTAGGQLRLPASFFRGPDEKMGSPEKGAGCFALSSFYFNILDAIGQNQVD